MLTVHRSFLIVAEHVSGQRRPAEFPLRIDPRMIEPHAEPETRPMMRFAHVFTVVMLAMAPPGCQRALTSTQDTARVEPPVNQKELSFKEEEESALKGLAARPGYAILQSIPTKNLFSYVSGYYSGGHHFPALYCDVSKKTFTVTHTRFQQTYDAQEIDKALATYRTLLINTGYEVGGAAKDTKNYVWVNGRKMVYMDLADLFPDPGDVKSHFASEQYDYIYSKLDGWRAFTYLSGLGGNSVRDSPLMVGLGYRDTARIRVLGRQVAEEFRFADLDTAFKRYREYVQKRLAGSP